ncbi:hypothetical protein X946_5207 [Burkholderia sp. ABCPW 111]|nr:hypothetical protein X946_5207 [Burkholderia sp. ABCPW 111]
MRFDRSIARNNSVICMKLTRHCMHGKPLAGNAMILNDFFSGRSALDALSRRATMPRQRRDARFSGARRQLVTNSGKPRRCGGARRNSTQLDAARRQDSSGRRSNSIRPTKARDANQPRRLRTKISSQRCAASASACGTPSSIRLSSGRSAASHSRSIATPPGVTRSRITRP